MHDIFCNPELVASILTAGTILSPVTIDHALLKVCLRVNRLFSHEANRILWKRCGTGFPCSYSEPKIHALANIAAQDVSRAQYHANYIRELRFVRTQENWPKATDLDQWHDHLMGLNFPVLESFTSDKRTIVMGSPHEDLKTAGPFYDFRCPERGGLFWHVLRSSPQLKAISLALNEPDVFEDVEEEAIEFIKSTPALSSLSLQFVPDLRNNIWQPGVLSSLGALPMFRKLEGMNLRANTLQDLPDGSFPALKELATTYTGSMAVLPTRFPYLSVLDLGLSEPIRMGLGRLANLCYLTCLVIGFAEGSTFSGLELIALANGCPNLTIVHLPSARVLTMEDPCPRGEDISDATIEAFARALPNLDDFSIGLENRSALTHQSIISLARHCPQLGYFHITANVCIPDLIEGLEKLGNEPLKSMNYMQFYLPETVKHKYEDIDGLAEQLVRKLAPRIYQFEIIDGSESDEEFWKLVEDSRWPRINDMEVG